MSLVVEDCAYFISISQWQLRESEYEEGTGSSLLFGFKERCRNRFFLLYGLALIQSRSNPIERSLVNCSNARKE